MAWGQLAKLPYCAGQHDMAADIFGPKLGLNIQLRAAPGAQSLRSQLVILLNYVVYRTKIGKAMRATAQDREAAALMGINVNNTIAFAFLLGGALAGAAGRFSGCTANSRSGMSASIPGLKAFTAAVLGGIGNLVGATIGGFTIGIVAAFQLAHLWGRLVNSGCIQHPDPRARLPPSGIMGEHTVEKCSGSVRMRRSSPRFLPQGLGVPLPRHRPRGSALLPRHLPAADQARLRSFFKTPSALCSQLSSPSWCLAFRLRPLV